MIILEMFAEYIKAAMDKATYEIIDDPEPFYGEIPELRGVWATGKTLESCRDNLMSALEDWICLSSQDWQISPETGGASITVSAEPYEHCRIKPPAVSMERAKPPGTKLR